MKSCNVLNKTVLTCSEIVHSRVAFSEQPLAGSSKVDKELQQAYGT